MNTLSFNVNNGRVLKLIQRQHDGKVLISIEDAKGDLDLIPDNEAFISAGDAVMLVNYFRNCKTGREHGPYIAE